ncbi:MAG TPA: tetratricopeptide repeat protein, partial [Thermoanaerobaculia bacterium]
GRLDEALAAHEEAMKASGGVANVALTTGTLLLRLGRFDEARAHAELAQQVSPGDAQSLLAEIALAQHQPAVAERAARAALAAGGNSMAPRLALAEVLVAEGRLEEALAQTDLVLAELARRAPGQSYPKLWWVRGDILARLQRDAEAEQAFGREIQSFPADTHTYASLAVLYAAEGKPDAAIGALRRLVESQGESPAACAEAVSTLRVLGDAPGAAALLRHALELHPGSSQLRALEHTG